MTPSHNNAVLVAALQMVSTPRVQDNLARAGEMIRDAAAQGAKLIVLPEYFPIMGLREHDKIAVREAEGSGPLQAFLAHNARQYGLWLVGGSIPLTATSPEKVRNTTLVYNPEGNCVARYDKIHLFGFSRGEERYDEANSIEAGQTPVTFETPFARVGLSICYDLRFPELYRALGTVDLLVIPAAFTETTGRAHWEILLRARAIENQCYVLAAGQGGRHENKRETHGNSMLIDPWGTIIARQDKGEHIVSGHINRTQIANIRESLPALSHRVLR